MYTKYLYYFLFFNPKTFYILNNITKGNFVIILKKQLTIVNSIKSITYY